MDNSEFKELKEEQEEETAVSEVSIYELGDLSVEGRDDQTMQAEGGAVPNSGTHEADQGRGAKPNTGAGRPGRSYRGTAPPSVPEGRSGDVGLRVQENLGEEERMKVANLQSVLHEPKTSIGDIGEQVVVINKICMKGTKGCMKGICICTWHLSSQSCQVHRW